MPVRDQNHVVRGKKPSHLFGFFLLVFEKGFKSEKPNDKDKICLVFFNLMKKFKYIKMD